MYERFKLILARRRTESGLVRDLPAVEAAACGSVAGGIAAAVTTPLDVCKTRIMLSGRTVRLCEALSRDLFDQTDSLLLSSLADTATRNTRSSTSNSSPSSIPTKPLQNARHHLPRRRSSSSLQWSCSSCHLDLVGRCSVPWSV